MALGTYQAVKVERKNGIARVTLNRRDKRNPMRPQPHCEMVEVLAELVHDPETKVLVLTGTGNTSCSGQDLKLFFRDLEGKPAEAARGHQAKNIHKENP